MEEASSTRHCHRVQLCSCSEFASKLVGILCILCNVVFYFHFNLILTCVSCHCLLLCRQLVDATVSAL